MNSLTLIFTSTIISLFILNASRAGVKILPCDSKIAAYDELQSLVCTSTIAEIESFGVDVPHCPANNDFNPLPATTPSGGIFVHYTANNANFLKDLIRTMRRDQPWVKINIVLNNSPYYSDSLKRDFNDSPKLLNGSNVNIIPVSADASRIRWAQDSYQIGQLSGKPTLYKFKHLPEIDSLAQEISEACGMPVIRHSSLYSDWPRNGDMGGNIEAMPGNFLIAGSNMSRHIKTDFFRMGNDILPLDTSFLQVGHVDEMFSVARTGSGQCDFVLLAASPKLGYKLLDEAEIKSPSRQDQYLCKRLSKSKIETHDENGNFVRADYAAYVARDSQCFGIYGSTLYDFLQIDGLREKNLSEYQATVDKNKERLLEKFKKTGCSPKVIEVPVVWDEHGEAVLPNIVNGLSLTKSYTEPSLFIAPKTYFSPFDYYARKSLARAGIKVVSINDVSYHRLSGEVHCGTNTIQVCKKQPI